MTAQPMDIAEPVASFKRKEASSPMTTQGASKEAKTAPMGGYKLTDKIVRLLLSEKSEAFAIGGPAATTPIYVCERADKIKDVWRGLTKHNFLSCPVLLKDEKRYFGIVDLADIVNYIVQHFGPESGQDKDFWEMVEAKTEFNEKTVADLMRAPLSRRNVFHPVSRGYSAWSVLEALARKPGLHRVPVVDRVTREMYNFVTGSQVINWLRAHIDDLGSIRDKPLSECASLFKKVVAVDEDSQAIAAFNLMLTRNISGVAVTDKEGRLTGTLSQRDLKLISNDARLFWRLQQTVKSFGKKLTEEFAERHKRPYHVVHATASCTLGEIVQEMESHKIHRVFIVDSPATRKPVGVVSIKDVLRELVDAV